MAEENAALEVGSGELVAQISRKPYARRQYVDHGAGLQVTEDALKLVFVIRRANGEGVGGHSSRAGITEFLEQLDLDSDG
jgi:hypothetical protein